MVESKLYLSGQITAILHPLFKSSHLKLDVRDIAATFVIFLFGWKVSDCRLLCVLTETDTCCCVIVHGEPSATIAAAF